MRSLSRTHSSDSLAHKAIRIRNRTSFTSRFTDKARLNLRGWSLIELSPELWGAASLAVSLTKRNTTKLARVASSTITHALFAPSYNNSVTSTIPPQSISDALDFRPKFTLVEDLACAVVAALATLGIAVIQRPPPTFSPLYALSMVLACTVIYLVTRSWLLERHFKAIQRSERELSFPDSKFLLIDGIAIHYKSSLPPPPSSDSTTKTTAIIHCLHGFGASTYSWSFCQDRLALATSSLVSCHDMPGFGLSQRPQSTFPYSLVFNGDNVTRKIIETELCKIDSALNPKKIVVMGHSMGGAAVAEGVIRNPHGISAVILVAPAIVALWKGVPDAVKGDAVVTGMALTEELISPSDPPGIVSLETLPPSPPSPEFVNPSDDRKSNNVYEKNKKRPIGRVFVALVQAVMTELIRALISITSPFIVILLRNLVRKKSFWERGLSAAWSDKSKITKIPSYVDNYRLGQLIRGWETGIIRFVSARFSDKAGIFHAMASVLEGDGHLSQAEKLASVCAANNIKVLIIHGRDDILVPVANSRRLATILPAAELVEFENCGHMPHEEAPEQFVHHVERFVKSL